MMESVICTANTKGTHFYLFDGSLSNESYPWIDDQLIVDSMEDAWDAMMASDALTFTLSILSDLNIHESFGSHISVPSVPRNIPISLNIDCLQSPECNINLYDNSNFLTVYDTLNSSKLSLSMSGFTVNLFGNVPVPGALVHVDHVRNIDILLDEMTIYGGNQSNVYKPIYFRTHRF